MNILEKLEKKHYQIAGLSGLICIAFGLAFYLVKRELPMYVIMNFVLGAALISFYIYYNIKDLSKILSPKSLGTKKNIVVEIVSVLGIIIVINLISGVLYWGSDLTRDKVTSISDNSQKVIKWIKNPLEILVFGSTERRDYEEYLLQSYNFYNRNITYRFLDPDDNPQLAQEYGVTRPGQAVIKFVDGHALVGTVNEEDITNVILQLTQPAKNVVYFMVMHGEHDVEDFDSNKGYGLLWRELTKENYTVKKLKLEPPNYYLPGDCTMLLIGGPVKMYTQMEKKAIKEYLDNNGRAVFLIDPGIRSGLNEITEDWGITLNDDVIVDAAYPSLIERAIARITGKKLMINPVFQVIANEFPENEITKDLVSKSIVFSLARTLEAVKLEKPDFNLNVKVLARSTKNGWGESDVESVLKYSDTSYGPLDRRGPFDVAMLSIKGPKESSSKLVVIGDSDFVCNEYIHQLYNRDFFMNVMAYLSNQSPLISVRPRHMFASRIDYDPVAMTRIFTLSVLVFPQLLLLAGLAIWRLRH